MRWRRGLLAKQSTATEDNMELPSMDSDGPMNTGAPLLQSDYSTTEHIQLRLNLSSFTFHGGVSALPALYRQSPGGTFGKVILGVLASSGVPVAVKLMLTNDSARENRTAYDAFLREAENLFRLRGEVDTVRALRHRGGYLKPADEGANHVAYFYGAGEEADLAAVHPDLPRGHVFIIAVEPLEETLYARMRRAPGGLLPIGEALRTAHGIALGLAFMAAHHVIHADLKPDNIMYRASGDAVLCDLGVGRIDRAATATVGPKFYGGTFPYVVPEQYVNGAAATSASDVYAFAMVLWCLFTGRPHAWFDASGRRPDQDDVARRVIRGERPDCTALRADAPNEAVAVMLQGWSQRPADRPSAVDIAVRLARLF